MPNPSDSEPWVPDSRPVLWLDASLPKTHSVPVHPATGEIWEEKQVELIGLRTEWLYESDDDAKASIKALCDAAQEGVTFADKPYFRAETVLLGGAFKGVVDAGTVIVSCHPETWAALPEEERAKYRVKTHGPTH